MPEMMGDAGEREPIPYILSVVAQSVLLAWIYNSTRGSLLLVILCHGAVNTAAKFLLPEFDSASRLIAWWCYAAFFVLAAGTVVAVAGAERLTTTRSRTDGVMLGGPDKPRADPSCP